MQDENEKWIELNATQYEIQMNPVGEGQNVLIVIGEGLEEDCTCKILWNSCQIVNPVAFERLLELTDQGSLK